MQVQMIAGGLLPTNCYLFVDPDTGKAAIVDPGFFSPVLEEAVAKIGEENVEAILLTHGHYDHIMGVPEIRDRTGAKIYVHENDGPFLSNSALNLSRMITERQCEPMEADVLLRDGDSVRVGSLTVRLLHTPGHTGGSSCYLTEDVLFSGDTLFRGGMGRTDFPSSDPRQMEESLRRLYHLEGDYKVYPGHGAGSTLDYERHYNPFLREQADDISN